MKYSLIKRLFCMLMVLLLGIYAVGHDLSSFIYNQF